MAEQAGAPTLRAGGSPMQATGVQARPQPSSVPPRIQGPRQAAPQAAAQRPRPAAKFSVRAVCNCEGEWWLTKIPGRLWKALEVATAPLRALVWILDGLVAASVLSVVAVGWAWWTERITDEQVAEVLGQIGARGLSILSKSGIL